jgi:transposase-like protein
MIGLALVNGGVTADVIPESEAEALRPMLPVRSTRQLTELPSLRGYSAVVYRGRFHRLAATGHPAAFGRIEAFWSYLQRQLRAKGGIRRERLELYLAEYVWRYNHRDLRPAEQLQQLFELLPPTAGRWKQQDCPTP